MKDIKKILELLREIKKIYEGGDKMKNIQNFINFIRNNAPREEYYVMKRKWEKFLTENCPNWKLLVKDQNNWPLIEKVEPPNSFNNLCDVLVDAAGTGLAIRWFNSDIKEQRKASRDWLSDVLHNLTPKIWNELNDDAKEYVIHYVFDRYPGEPFETYQYFARAIEHLAHEHHRLSSFTMVQPFVPIGYVPSKGILQLRSVIQRAGDKKFLKVVEYMINERKEACEKPFSLPQTSRFLYTPTGDEQELIARVIDKFRVNGYMASALPQIYLSLETPPLFAAYPELEEYEEEETGIRRPEQREPNIPRNRERGRPETISIEELLGCYIPNPQIVLYHRGLKWCAKRYDLDEELLRGIVLVHEIGHWVTHLLPKPNVPFWPTELYKLTSMEVCEGWAQLITWWVVDEVGGNVKQVFEKLNRLQPHPYRVYEQFKSKSVSSVIDSLEMLRQLRWPAGIDDWRRFIK